MDLTPRLHHQAGSHSCHSQQVDRGGRSTGGNRGSGRPVRQVEPGSLRGTQGSPAQRQVLGRTWQRLCAEGSRQHGLWGRQGVRMAAGRAGRRPWRTQARGRAPEQPWRASRRKGGPDSLEPDMGAQAQAGWLRTPLGALPPLPELSATASGKGKWAFQQWTLRNSSPGLPSGQGAFHCHHRTWASNSLAQWRSRMLALRRGSERGSDVPKVTQRKQGTHAAGLLDTQTP